MSRYFKQIAKSVRANGSASSGSEENADDFLGCINVPLNVSVQTNDPPPSGFRVAVPAIFSLQEMPVVGYDCWFKLEPRSSTSKVQGDCHLILSLFTKQVRGRRRGSPGVGEKTADAVSFLRRETRPCRRKTPTSPSTGNC